MNRNCIAESFLKRALLPTLAAAAFSVSSAHADIVYAWGYNNYGQLGDGTITNQSAPVPVRGLSDEVTAVALSDHGLGIQNGAVYAWGNNAYGELGDGTTTGHRKPMLISRFPYGVTAISSGRYNNLAIQYGNVFAWGDNAFGEIGDGTTTQRNTPVEVVGLPFYSTTAVSVGAGYSMAVCNGAAYAWGLNSAGQLGDGTTMNRSAPVAVLTLSTGVTAVAGAASHSLAIRDGGVYAWGYNDQGDLGIGTWIETNESIPELVLGLSSGVTAIAAGENFNFAVKNGRVYAWGDDSSGQLGDGRYDHQNTPEQIAPTDLTNIVSVAAGFDSGYALSTDGSLWVWGDNTYGELGLPTFTSNVSAPQHLLPPKGYVFTSIAASWDDPSAIATLTPTPEPTTLTLLFLGAIPLLTRRCH